MTKKTQPPTDIFAGTPLLKIFGAREHNLKNIDLTLPRNRMTVITGISGSGKSSLAFDTIYAEGQRRYMESLSAYARQFIGNMERPDVEQIDGLSPVIAIEQKTTNRNPRSTVGTVTEVYDFLRLLYARIGEAYSYVTGKKMVRYTEQQIIDTLFQQYANHRIALLAPLVRGRKGHYRELFEQIHKQGYLKVRIDGEMTDVTPKMQVDRYKTHDIEVVIDRLKITDEFRHRIASSLDVALKMGQGLVMVTDLDDTTEARMFSKRLVCPDSGIAYEDPSPNTFSFNSPYGACPTCKGLGFVFEVNMQAVLPDKTRSIAQQGIVPLGEVRDTHTFKIIEALAKQYQFTLDTPIDQIPEQALEIILYGSNTPITISLDYGKKNTYQLEFEGIIHFVKRAYTDKDLSERLRQWAEDFMHRNECPECAGQRLKKEALYYKVADYNIADLCRMDIAQLQAWFIQLSNENAADLTDRQRQIAKDIIKEIKERLSFLYNVGLSYLSLDRNTATLSGGESQRIRLATQIGSQLMGITYILDEPSIGLHQRDNHQLIDALAALRDVGNTVLVVEHDKDIMLAADYIVDIGPRAGIHGGEVVAQGTPKNFINGDSLTAQYLRGDLSIPHPTQRRTGNGNTLRLIGATGHNLKSIDLVLPLGTLICITGVSGSGKSTLVNDTLYPILTQHFYQSLRRPLPYQAIEGLEHLDKVIEIDQAPIGRTPRSNPATYTGVFTAIRDLFAQLPESQIRGYKPGRFSFNVKGGRCEVCEGGGMKVVEMNFLPDIYVSCEKCLGKRYNRETLEVRYKGKSIGDVLDMTVEEALSFFESIPKIYLPIKTLHDVGLGYITLGQPATTLSGGEAQRVKLSAELRKRDTGKTIYILDEPTTGLHFEDIRVLLDALQKIVDKGNTVVIIEHNLDVIKTADYIVDIGPEAGQGGGTIVCSGTPEQIAQHPTSHTAHFLRLELPN